MSFLAPLFLLGLALVVGPVLFHLIRQTPRNRVVFSSTDLLEPSPPKQQKSRRIQNPWLLLLRCLIIALLAFAFARPFLPNTSQQPSANDIRRDIVIALDSSFSMTRPELAAQARDEALAILEKISPSDQVSIFSFNDSIETLVSSEQWADLSPDRRKAFAAEQIKRWTPSNFPGELDQAIAEAVSQIQGLRERSSASGYGEIYLLSDFSEGTSLNEIELIDWPPSVRLARVPITLSDPGPNLSLRWIIWSETEDSGPVAQIAIATSQPNRRTVATISIQDASGRAIPASTREFVLEGASETVVSLPVEKSLQNSPLVFVLEGDQQVYDNKLPIAPEFIPRVSIGLYSESATDFEKAAPYFISKAVQGFESPLTRLDPQSPSNSSHQAYLVNRPLTSNEASALRRELENGKTALLLVNGSQFVDTLNLLTASDSWILNERPKQEKLLIGEIDFNHAFFRPFASPRFSNFANINTWEAPELEPPSDLEARHLARFDDNSPLLSEIQIGQGSLYVWSGSWSPQASQWVLSSKFIPFLHRFVLGASGGPPLPSNLALTQGNAARLAAILPDQNIDQVGLYQVPNTENRWIALQSNPEESRTNPITLDAWEQLGLPDFDESVALAQIERILSQSATESATRTEERQRLWQWLLWLVLALLALESFVAIKSIQRREALPQ